MDRTNEVRECCSIIPMSEKGLLSERGKRYEMGVTGDKSGTG